MYHKISRLQSLQISSPLFQFVLRSFILALHCEVINHKFSTRFLCFTLTHPYNWRDMILTSQHFLVKTYHNKDQLFLISLNMNKSTVKGSHWRCSVRKGVLRNFAKLTGKHLSCGFSCVFCEIYKNTFLTQQVWATASYYTVLSLWF